MGGLEDGSDGAGSQKRLSQANSAADTLHFSPSEDCINSSHFACSAQSFLNFGRESEMRKMFDVTPCLTLGRSTPDIAVTMPLNLEYMSYLITNVLVLLLLVLGMLYLLFMMLYLALRTVCFVMDLGWCI